MSFIVAVELDEDLTEELVGSAGEALVELDGFVEGGGGVIEAVGVVVAAAEAGTSLTCCWLGRPGSFFPIVRCGWWFL